MGPVHAFRVPILTLKHDKASRVRKDKTDAVQAYGIQAAVPGVYKQQARIPQQYHGQKGGRDLEPTSTKGPEEKEMAGGVGPGNQAQGTGAGVYVSLHGRFSVQKDRGRIQLPGKPGQEHKELDAGGHRQADNRRTGKGSRAWQHDRPAGQKKHTAHNSQHGRGSSKDNATHGLRNTVRHGHPMHEEEEYSSTCCGKCKYFFRPWRSGVWVCSNVESEKNGFPTNYASTCPLFAREDW